MLCKNWAEEGLHCHTCHISCDAILGCMVLHQQVICMLCRYGPQQMASLTYSISMAAAPREGMVHGAKGNIKLHASMHALNKFTVNITGE